MDVLGDWTKMRKESLNLRMSVETFKAEKHIEKRLKTTTS